MTMTTTTTSPYITNFPFTALRANQEYILKEIELAFSSYRYIILEAPTGTGKSPLGIASAMAQGSSYICTSTKNLQTQYNKDFPWVYMAKGRGNFSCPILQDRNAPYTTADHAPCLDSDYKCSLKTRLKDYYKEGDGKHELISFHRSRYSDSGVCEYYHQKNKSLTASHSVINYSMMLSLLHQFPTRELLILDEAHELPQEIIKFHQFSISSLKWKKYMGPYFVIPKLDIDNLRSWIDFLITLQEDLLKRVKISNDLISDISNEYKQLLSGSGDLERLKSIIQLIQTTTRFKELSVNAQQDIDRLIMAISTISSEPQNWIVSDLKFDAKSKDVVKVEFKPLDVSKFCKSILEKGKKVLMMSATILDSETFSQDIGLAPNDVKIIKVGSTFPIENRQIHPLNIAKLNKDTWAREEVKLAIVRAIDKVMSHFKDRKGLIHCTSYDQLYFIIANISQENKRRLLKTDPDKERDLVIEKHIDSIEPTVLISPSLHLGIDLKDDLSRFQIIVKLPYANLGDRWINAKRNKPGGDRWYAWLSALHTVQAYGRSVRSENDWAYTFVLDSNFNMFVNMNRNILPTWFLDAIKVGQ